MTKTTSSMTVVERNRLGQVRVGVEAGTTSRSDSR